MEEAQILEKLDTLLEQAVRRSVVAGSQPIGLVFSGGVDSSLLAKVHLDLNIPITLICAGVKGFFKDEPFVDSFAKKFSLPLIKAVIEPEEARLLASKLASILRKIGLDFQNYEFNPKRGWENQPLQVSLAMPFYLAAQSGSAQGITAFACAQAGDELFGGGFSHQSVSPIELNQVLKQAFDRLMAVDQIRDKAMFSHFGASLLYPLADPEFSAFSLVISPEYKIRADLGEQGRKYIWRQLALKRGVPKENALRKSTRCSIPADFGEK